MPAFHRTAEDEHDAAVAVVGAAIAILACGTPELGHGDDRDIFHTVAHIVDECGERAGELARHVAQLVGLVLMVIPSADLGERGFHACARFDEACDLLKAASELAALK